jgi:hypothetical protein
MKRHGKEIDHIIDPRRTPSKKRNGLVNQNQNQNQNFRDSKLVAQDLVKSDCR